MTRKRHTEEQIIAVLKNAQAGVSVQDLCRKHGISDATFNKWRATHIPLTPNHEAETTVQERHLCITRVRTPLPVRQFIM
jgi:transposase-like protein